VFEQGAWADRVLSAGAGRHKLDPRQRAQAQRLAYGAVQRRGTSDHLIAHFAARDVDRLDPPVRAALRLGIYELLHSASAPDHASVDQAVELARSGVLADHAGAGRRADAAAGFANAVLRRVATEGDAVVAELDDSTPEGAAVVHSYPEWLARQWWEELGPAGTRALMAAMNAPAETAFRVNTILLDADEALKEILTTEPGVRRSQAEPPLAPSDALIVEGQVGDGLGRRITAGELVPQARGSQAVVALLDPRPGERILDLCAAPGIKTAAIAARLRNQGEIVAVELDRGRARRLRELCRRLGVECVRVVEGDAAKADFSAGYDRILVDPPCSDLGTLASRPDARWHKSRPLIERLAPIQASILARAARALRGGGTLVYATCTISAAENEGNAERLLAREPGLRAEDLGATYPGLASERDSRFLQTRPDRDRTDGFFIARFTRTDSSPSEPRSS
jgi:16S rRNA (cytosine967-C5)-methyltransferase